MNRIAVKNVQNGLIELFYEPVRGQKCSNQSHRAVL